MFRCVRRTNNETAVESRKKIGTGGTFVKPQLCHGVVDGWARMIAADKVGSAFLLGCVVLFLFNFCC